MSTETQTPAATSSEVGSVANQETPATLVLEPAKQAVPGARKSPAKAAKRSTAKVPAAEVAPPAEATVAPVAETPVAEPVKETKPNKTVKVDKVKKAEKIEKVEKMEKTRRAKLIRDSFTMPEDEYEHLAELKKRLLPLGVAAKKSELLRAGVALLAALADQELTNAMAGVEVIKTGRPAR